MLNWHPRKSIHINRNDVLVLLALIIPPLIEIIASLLLVRLGVWTTKTIHPASLFLIELFNLSLILLINRKIVEKPFFNKVRVSIIVTVAGLIGAFSVQGIMICIEIVLGRYFPIKTTGAQTQIDYLNLNTPIEMLFALIAIALVGPITEEIVFRKMLFSALRCRFDATITIVLSAAVFSVAHMDMSVAISTFGIGLWLGYVYERFHSIVLNIFIHGIMNGLVLMAVIIYGNDADSQMPMNIENILLEAVRMLALIVCSIGAIEWMVRRCSGDG